MKKVMYAVLFRSTRLLKAIRLDEQNTFIAKLYTEKCLPEVLEVGKCRSRVSDKDYTAT